MKSCCASYQSATRKSPCSRIAWSYPTAILMITGGVTHPRNPALPPLPTSDPLKSKVWAINTVVWLEVKHEWRRGGQEGTLCWVLLLKLTQNSCFTFTFWDSYCNSLLAEVQPQRLIQNSASTLTSPPNLVSSRPPPVLPPLVAVLKVDSPIRADQADLPLRRCMGPFFQLLALNSSCATLSGFQRWNQLPTHIRTQKSLLKVVFKPLIAHQPFCKTKSSIHLPSRLIIIIMCSLSFIYRSSVMYRSHTNIHFVLGLLWP